MGATRRNYTAFLYIIPSLALVIIFNYIPILESFYRSLFAWRGGARAIYLGLENYRELLGDSGFGVSVRNMLQLLGFHLIAIVTMPLLVAELIFGIRHKPGLSHGYRLLFVIPMVVPQLVVLLIWSFIYDGEVGLLNAVLRSVGLGHVTRGWLADPGTALYAIMGVGFPWVQGTAVLIYLAGLLAVSEEIWDVTRLDGIKGLRRFFSIDLHLIMGQIKLLVILTIINQTQYFVGILVLTGGGPGYATLVPGLYLYQQAFDHARMGYANAIGVVLFVFLMIVTVLNMTILRSDTGTRRSTARTRRQLRAVARTIDARGGQLP